MIAEGANLIDQLLLEQRTLTPVERFAKHHDTYQFTPRKSYQELIPLSKPKPGEQYRFEVDLDKCSGCKACVSACHSMNGLDDDEAWRDVGLLFGESTQQVVTTACHHCADPACANGCPVLAYDKDEATGIVRHLDDQCIGCQYCILKCPYDVPKYNPRLGIVRKCDMCHQRLAVGEAPACVQACPHEAIRIVMVTTEKLNGKLEPGEVILPGAFPSDYTRPSTAYLNQKPAPLQAANELEAKPQHAHLPLTWMLVMTQLSTGLLVGGLWALLTGKSVGWIYWAAAAMTGALGVAGSMLHLGQPFRAWKAFLGWRRSWLSREILAFGAFVPAAFAIVPVSAGWVPAMLAPLIPPVWLLAAGAVAAGLASVACSVMVYVDTRRSFWSLPRTGLKFALTMAGGAALGLLALGDPSGGWLALGAALSLLGLMVVDLTRRDKFGALWQPARIMRGPLRGPTLALGAFGLTLAPLGGLIGATGLAFAWPAALVLILGINFLERWLFFTAVDAPKMPGQP